MKRPSYRIRKRRVGRHAGLWVVRFTGSRMAAKFATWEQAIDYVDRHHAARELIGGVGR